MRIGLFGFTFAHENMGCQALTCSFLELVRQVYDGELEVVSFHNESSLGSIPELFPDITFSKCRVKLKDPKLAFLKEVKKCDIVFDVTYGDGFSDIYFTKSTYKNTITKILCEKTKVPFVLMPQTYGPFKHKMLEKLAGKAIRWATVAYARDEISARYAEKLSRRSVQSVTDMAFFLPYDQTLPHFEKSIGLNVSGLLWKGGLYQESDQFGMKTDYHTYCRELIRHCHDLGYEVHLIPHVTQSGNEGRVIPDPDYPACQALHEEFPYTVLAPNFATPYEAKNYISRLDLFVGSRMHATIGAFSSGVVTIPFAYSRKFKGLFTNFGYPYFVDGTKTDTQESLRRTFRLIDRKDKLKETQQKSLIRISELKEEFLSEIATYIFKASN
ncbi:MAG: polysaccharide pyruvyl transferase family protein [Lachnospiraceae bacterium]|nr:polysaccharide pyruvyl transferase family protein [Lachnospiraceae bacterium]